MTVRELLQKGTDRLKAAGVENADYDARQLLFAAFGKSPALMLAELRRETDESDGDAVRSFEEMIEKRAARLPLQRILGSTGFMGLEFELNEATLIPRQDTELLVETVLKYEHGGTASAASAQRQSIKAQTAEAYAGGSVKTDRRLEKAPESHDSGMQDGGGVSAQETGILDMCTGSGCIGISLKKLGGFKKVTLSDISADALAAAELNARKNGVSVGLVCSDMFEGIEGSFDVIVSNPPYIESGVIPGLEPEVREHEPLRALDGGADGLDFYRRLLEGCEKHLKPQGRVYFEIGFNQGAAVSSLLKQAGYGNIVIIKDMAGLDRVVMARREF